MKLHAIQERSDLYSVTLEGELDAQGCQSIRNDLEHTAEQVVQGSVQIDLGGVNFIDSSGIGAIVFLFKRLAARDCHMFLSHVHGQPRELLENLRIDKAIEVHWLEATPQLHHHSQTAASDAA